MDERSTLLLVEDDTTTRELLALLLAGDGWQVHRAESGEAALAWLHTASDAPSVILCDQRMPGLCGAPLATAIRSVLSSRFLAHTTILLAMTATTERATLEGYAHVLLKPFSAESVRSVLNAQLHGLPRIESGSDTDAISGTNASEPGLPILDATTVAQLRKSMPEARLKELFAFAMADAGDRLQRLSAFSDVGARSDFVHEAHALKGSFGVIGARQLWTLADEAEKLSSAPDAFRLLSHNKVEGLRSATEQLRLMLVTLFPA